MSDHANHARPVWLTEQELRSLDLDGPEFYATVRKIATAWDDATPDDVTQAEAAVRHELEHRYGIRVTDTILGDVVRAVMVALGAPDG